MDLECFFVGVAPHAARDSCTIYREIGRSAAAPWSPGHQSRARENFLAWFDLIGGVSRVSASP